MILRLYRLYPLAHPDIQTCRHECAIRRPLFMNMASASPHPLEPSSSDSLRAPARTVSPGSPSAALLSPRIPSSASGLKGLNNPLTSKVTSVLSASYTDADFRDSLALLDERNVHNNAETRRRLRLDVQKEVIDSNGEVIAEFGRVAEVGCFCCFAASFSAVGCKESNNKTATPSHR